MFVTPAVRRLSICASLTLLILSTLPKTGESAPTMSQSRVNAPVMTVQQSKDEFSNRRAKRLASSAAGTMESDPYGGVAIAKLATATGSAAEPNANLRYVSQWFDHPHPHGRDHRGECDFAAMKLALAYHLLGPNGKDGLAGRLEPATVEAIKRFFLTTDFQSMYNSENHHLLFRTSRYLMAHALKDEKFGGYGNKTGSEIFPEDAAWLSDFIRFRARRGWGEFDSACYIAPDMECLLALHDFAPEPALRKAARMMIDLLLTDMTVDSRNGMLGGANGRIYSQHARDHAQASTYGLQYLYFGNVDSASVRSCLLDALVSDYRPNDLVLQIALDRNQTYENRERKHLHNMSDVRPDHPLTGSIRKYTLMTPDYMMGCVQYQDPYPADCPSRGYAGHEQHDWDLTVPTRTTARIFTHHPGKSGNEHGYWTGDLNCMCGHFFQNATALMALYDIPAEQPYQFIHAWAPRAAFDEVVDEKGIVFLRSGRVFAALRMLGGHEWTREGEWKDQEVISQGAKNGVICEVATVDEFPDFAAFRKAIAATLGTDADGVRFDPHTMHLSYRSTRAGTLTMNTGKLRQIDGKDVSLDYPTYDCPYLSSGWDSGVIEMKIGGRRRVLDFIGGEERE